MAINKDIDFVGWGVCLAIIVFSLVYLQFTRTVDCQSFYTNPLLATTKVPERCNPMRF